MQLHEDMFEYLYHSCDRNNAFKELPFFKEQFWYDTSSGITLRPSDSVKDLGVIVSAVLKWEIQINAMIKKAKRMSAWAFNVLKCRDTTTMMTLYKSMVRSAVEYCCPLWHPSKVGLTQKIEALQRTFTARLAQCQDMNYWERLKSLKLMSLQRQRERYVIMTMWKILNGHHPNNIGIEFQSSKTQRDHRKAPKTLEVGQGETPDDVRYIFRSTRPKLWNLIPANVSSVKDIEVFKIELNKDFVSKMPDKPPVKGYSCENNNSLLEWCSSGALLSGRIC